MVAYIDFETTAPTDNSLDPENKKVYAVLYVIIFAFHPKLKFNRVIIERSFRHSMVELRSLNYLTREQLTCKDDRTLLRLRDCTMNVAAKNDLMSISEMFSTELNFVADYLPRWFNKKIKSNNLELN